MWQVPIRTLSDCNRRAFNAGSRGKPFCYQLAEQFIFLLCHHVQALCLYLKESDKYFAELSGIALPITVSANGKSFSNQMLFTHRGLSGPAILQISIIGNWGKR
ncbi:NAD(P)/FAD-dependent oxidoreductase [Mannheimia haemolytica]|nr:NAD(P)/FAD-dependent oxidoreductase [Mannheimia haemolytica]